MNESPEQLAIVIIDIASVCNGKIVANNFDTIKVRSTSFYLLGTPGAAAIKPFT